MEAIDSLKVMLIEDDDSHAKIISRYLGQHDEKISLTRRSALGKGIECLLSEQFHAILLDLRLPDSDIDKTLNATLAKCPNVPIIVLSSIEDKVLARKMVHQGAQDYLCKSDLSTELLIRAISYSIERKKNETLLKESELIKSKVIESSLYGIISIDEAGNIIEFNSAAEKIFGYNQDEVTGKSLADVIIPVNLRERHRLGLSKFIESGVGPVLGKRIEVPAIRRDGTEFPVELSIVPLKLNNRFIFTGFLRDITEQRRAADDLRIAKEKAESANRAKSAFLANMSHEIRTPLGAVLGFSELLISPEAGQSEKISFVAAIKRNGEILSKVINDILDLSKIEAGKMETDFREVTLSELLSEIEALLKFQAENKGISLVFSHGKNLPVVVRTDPLRLKQILLNIVGNAIKFTQNGTVAVQALLVASPDPHRPKLSFVVTDSGKGISKDDVVKLFSPFTQVDMSSKRVFGGSGLGLALSRRLAMLLGGNVELTQTEPGHGSTFTITIDPGSYAVSNGELATQDKKFINGENIRLDGIRVLVADDSSDNRVLVSLVLKMAGATVDVATNGKEAVEKADKDKFEVLLMDLQMPVMDGYEATAELRKKGYEKPIVALTAHALIEEKQRCLASGFDDHISKPIDRTILIESVSRFSKRQ